MIWVYLFLITLFIRPQDWPGCFLYGVPVNDIIVGGGIFFALHHKFRQARPVMIQLTFFILLFCFYGLISNMANNNFHVGIAEFTVLFKRFLVYLIFFIIVDSCEKMNKVMAFSTLLIAILTFQSIYQAFYGVGWAHQSLHTHSNIVFQNAMLEFNKYGTRTFWIGLWDGPNVLALAFLFAVPFCIENLFKENTVRFKSFIYMVCLVFLIIGIFSTQSRGAFLALILLVCCFFTLRFNFRKTVGFLTVIIPLLLIFIPVRMGQLNSQETSAHLRTWLWEQGLNMLMANPLFGVGKGQFANVVNEHIISHSNYVQNMAEMGLPGLLLYVLLLYWPMKYLWLIFKVAVNSKEHAQLCAMSRVLLITLLSFVLTTAFVVMEHDILYILWALSASLILIGKNTLFPDKKLVLSSWDWLMVSLLCVACVFIIWVVSVKEII